MTIVFFTRMWFFQIFVFLLFLLSSIYLPAQSSSKAVCQTNECKEVAKRILSNVDVNVDPCEDFYKFTCGRFADRHPLEGEDIVHGLSLMKKELTRRISSLLDDNHIKNHGSKIVRSVKKQYDRCLLRGINNYKISGGQNNLGSNFVPDQVDQNLNVKPKDKKTICRNVVESNYPYVMVRLYIDKYFKLNDHDISREIIISVINRLSDEVKHIPWMDKDTRKSVLTKLSHMVAFTGRPDWVVKDQELDKEYSEDEVSDLDNVFLIFTSLISCLSELSTRELAYASFNY